MTTKLTAVAACAVLMAPGLAAAQDISGAATLGYAHSSISNGGGDANTYSLDGRGSFAFRNGWAINLDGSFAHSDPDGSGDIGVTDIGAEAIYTIPSGAMFGAYVDYADIDGNGTYNINADVTSYGLTGGYQGQFLRAEANIGWAEASVAGLGSDDEWRDYGVNIAYTPTTDTKIAGHWQLSDLNTRVSGTNVHSYGIGASHYFGSGFIGFGGVSRVDFDASSTDLTSYGLGVGYDLQQVSRVPGQISLELARTTLDGSGAGDTDDDSIRLGLTIPFGKTGGGAPLNSLADSIMEPRHNAVSTLIDNSF